MRGLQSEREGSGLFLHLNIKIQTLVRPVDLRCICHTLYQVSATNDCNRDVAAADGSTSRLSLTSRLPTTDVISHGPAPPGSPRTWR